MSFFASIDGKKIAENLSAGRAYITEIPKVYFSAHNFLPFYVKRFVSGSSSWISGRQILWKHALKVILSLKTLLRSFFVPTLQENHALIHFYDNGGKLFYTICNRLPGQLIFRLFCGNPKARFMLEKKFTKQSSSQEFYPACGLCS